MGNAYPAVLEWSQNRPAWQRDALRRLAGGNLNEADISELTALCKRPHGLDGPEHLNAVPLNSQHLPVRPAGAGAVVLAAIRETQDINALMPAQELRFASKGLTIVYGENGAGKSSYARVLKRLCRARGGQEPIVPDLLAAAGAAGTPSATIDFLVADEQRTVRWVEGGEGGGHPQELSGITVFDTTSARVYVGDRTDIAFQPQGLDLLKGLAGVCDAVRAKLESEVALVDARRLQHDAIGGETEIGTFLRALTAKTKASEVEARLVFSADEEAVLQRLQGQLASLIAGDPVGRIQELKLRLARLEALKARCVGLTERLSEAKIEQLRAAQQAVENTHATVELASSSAFGGEPLPGVGEHSWRQLWEAARRFAAEAAYLGKSFPVVEPGARCLLCHQELAPDAAERMQRFEAFIKQETAAASEAAGRAFETAVAILEAAVPLANLEEASLAEVTSLGAEAGKEVQAFFQAGQRRIRSALAAAKGNGSWEEMCSMPGDAALTLEALMRNQQAELLTLDQQRDPGAKQALEKQIAELAARQEAARRKADVVAECHRLEQREALKRCIKDTDTAGISRFGNELAKELVSDALREAFVAELTNLGLKRVAAGVAPAGAQKGVLLHQVQLSTVDGRPVKPDLVVSEGEHRAIALAAFVAELSHAPEGSGVVLDDPVSSLDHRCRERVAKRIVQEALNRQVIVFTHDLVFMLLLQEHATNSGHEPTWMHVQRFGGAPGKCDPGVPWTGANVRQRLERLRKEGLEEAKRLFDGDQQVYAEKVKTIYGKLREAWERAIEEVLLKSSIVRFSREIKTKSLKQVVDYCESDYRAIETGMGKCSAQLQGHDDARELAPSLPDPTEILKDIEALSAWVTVVNRRRADQGKPTGPTASASA